MGGIRKRNRHKNPKKNDRENFNPKGGYKDIVRENAAFEAFYRSHEGMCKAEEFDKMMTALKSDLPASFRVTGFRSQAFAVRDLIEGTYFTALTNALKAAPEEGDVGGGENAAKAISPPKSLPWYPDRLAWQLSITRNDIRREETLYKLHNFLISETESGNISRQETVSMIPPIVLDVKPHHKVLDMCAAPGSKTAQLIEAIHAVEDVVPKGLVVANDSDNSRCYMLVHQAKRLQSPCVVITNHDASIMPNLKLSNGSDLRFDRILCDVPCSGDGTMRKNADIWPKWSAGTSTNLHGIQFRILKRGMELLEVGGRLVYSTCSLNPVEDEAVVQRLILEAGKENVAIEDPTHLVPGLKFSPGLTKWNVGSKDGDIYSTWSGVAEKHHSQIRPYMFPSEEIDQLNINRCLRVLPHQQDTGGFFVTVLVKKSPCQWESKQKFDSNGEKNGNENNDAKGNDAKPEPPPRKKPKRVHQGFKEDPYIYFDAEEPLFKEISAYYGLKELQPQMFLTRCKDTTKKNSLYYTSEIVRDILQSNEDRVKIINTGVKAFTRCENKGASCDFRLAQEGALMTIPFMSRRIVKPTLKDLEVLLLCNDVERPPDHEQLAQSTRDQIDKLDTGSVALMYEEQRQGYAIKLEFVGWKGKSSLRAYVPKNERVHYLRLIGGDTSKYERNKFEERRAKNNDEKKEEERSQVLEEKDDDKKDVEILDNE